MPLFQHRIGALFLAILSIFFSQTLLAASQHFKNWNLAIIQGPLSEDQKVRYYLQPLVTLRDDRYKINGALLFAGAGYQLSPRATFWLMEGYIYSQRPNGKLRHLNMLREQLNLILYDENKLRLSSITRFEQRKPADESQVAVRVREMITLHAPLPHTEKYLLVVFDEVFFNLNHPAWTNNNTFLGQNRVFIGIGTLLSKQIEFDIGYMNQYQMHTKNQKSNILYLALNITH